MLYYVRKLVNISLLLMYRILYRIVQTDKKTVLFMSFHGRSFSDNPRALYQEMKQKIGLVILVMFGSLEMLRCGLRGQKPLSLAALHFSIIWLRAATGSSIARHIHL